jgi:hypothetical protein
VGEALDARGEAHAEDDAGHPAATLIITGFR